MFFVIGIFINMSQTEDSHSILIGKMKVNTKDSLDETVNEKKSSIEVKDGLAVTIGKSKDDITKQFGKPTRKDLSSYGYEWWIYYESDREYFQLALEDGKVVSAYGIGEDVDVSPFKIGQPIDQIYSSLHVEPFVDITYKGNSYRFELSEEDMNIKPLIKLGDIHVQLYLDKFSGSVSSVRFLDDETLLKLRPYELSYGGELLEYELLTEKERMKVESGNEMQIFDITNIIRARYHLPKLIWDHTAADVAYLHSRDMSDRDYFSHVSETEGDLANRLQEGGVEYSSAGENIAYNYIDAIAVTEGWLNSKGHRDVLLNEEFTHLGVGVYEKYYTQNFITK